MTMRAFQAVRVILGDFDDVPGPLHDEIRALGTEDAKEEKDAKEPFLITGLMKDKFVQSEKGEEVNFAKNQGGDFHFHAFEGDPIREERGEKAGRRLSQSEESSIIDDFLGRIPSDRVARNQILPEASDNRSNACFAEKQLETECSTARYN